MNLTQYGDYFYLYMLLIALIPVIILGCFGRKTKYYGILLSIAMNFLLVGRGLGLKFLIVFLLGETILVYMYLYIRRKTDSKYIYLICLFLSMVPVITAKLSTAFSSDSALGFVGLSYLNFRVIAMIIEIYDGKIKDIDFFTYLYFILFFPTFSSGPIDRWTRFKNDLNTKFEKNEYLNEYLIPGVKKIVIAVLYKFVIAYLIHTYWMKLIPTDKAAFNIINYMYAYTMYLFFDFAGYSLFAIGTGYIMGIKVPENFNKPFMSKDMKEFWTRWHISLSRWFGDYIFSRFVLNSMRKKRFKSRFTASHTAQILTMFIMGMWHGLTPYYILYGLYQGMALVLTDIYQRKSKYYKKHKREKWFNCIQIVVTFHIICFGMLLFSGYLFE
ncbi:MAG: D-alanyl-lipoteichoic acid biosynthesis protein DltB [Clostridium sp.]|nr:D-alanyl-lipoteichoic acid biosynthesis protein DltB [Clostridium sp.]